jgi:transposase
MYDQGSTVSEISKELNSHYSYVYGVIERYTSKTGTEIRKTERTSKSDTIREMFDSGMKVGEIAKNLNSNYSFVFSVVKKYKESKQNKKIQNVF